MTKRKARHGPMTTPELIALAKRRLAEQDAPERRGQPMTDYRFAKLTGFRQVLVSNWQLGKTHIGRQFVGKFAELTGLPEPYIYACIELEREADPTVRGILSDLAQSFAAVVAKRAAVVTLGVILGGALPVRTPAQAAVPAPTAGNCLYIMFNRRCAPGRAWRRRRRPRPAIVASA